MNKKAICLVCVLAIACSAVGLYLYGGRETVLVGEKEVMGTNACVVVVTNQRDREKAEVAIEDSFNEMERVNNLFSWYDPTSPLSILNREGEVKRSYLDDNREKYGETGWEEFTWILERSRKIHKLTGGAFDVTVKPILELYYEYRGDPEHPTQEMIDDTLRYVNVTGVKITDEKIGIGDGMKITLDGIAKGYGVDRASEVLTRRGFVNHSVEIGGEVRCSGLFKGEKWEVEVTDPSDPDSVYGTLKISGLSVATSGQYYQWHIIDPTTGSYVEGDGSVTIVGENCTCCDALATALFVLAFDEGADAAIDILEDFSGYECLIIIPDVKDIASPGFGEITN